MQPDSLRALEQLLARVRAGDAGALTSLLRLRRCEQTATTAATDPLRALLGALETLGEEQRIAIRMLWFERRDLDSVAARLNRSVPAVRALCVRALVRLADVLAR